MKLAVIGAGWAGLSAALEATQRGHEVTVFEASRSLGGRARGVPVSYQHGPQEHHWLLDNGQHILIGAYSQTLALMKRVGTPSTDLLRTPLTLMYPDGRGLRCPDLSRLATNSIAFNSTLSLLEAMLGIASLPWRVSERWALMTRAMRWRQQKFSCAPELSVADLCAGLPTRVLQEFIEPLCVSALNTPTATASAQVFLRVLQDALLGPVDAHAKSWGLPSHLLIPRTDLGHLFPERAAQALAQAGVTLRSGERAQLTCATAGSTPPGWQVQGEHFDAVILATSASDAIKLLDSTAQDAPENIASHLMAWRRTTQALRYEPIATVYAYAPQARLKAPMLALHSSAQHPAQFVFDRGQLHPAQHGLLAFVVSASRGDAATLQTQVLAQAQAQLGLSLAPVKTLVEKRATFACTPGLERPSASIAPGLLACGDYIAGPYPATLEGAVRSGLSVIHGWIEETT